MYLISACLLGENCKYNGKNNYDLDVLEFSKSVSFASVCPEVLGGLSVPRKPCEIVKDKIMSKDGEDFTEEFRLGAKLTLDIAISHEASRAILKSKSPSCGVCEVYDGTFSGNLIPGKGITVQILKKNGIEVFSEKDLKILKE